MSTTTTKCRACGCTDDECAACAEKMGEPCFWIEPDLCSACAPPTQFADAVAQMVTGELTERGYPFTGVAVLILDTSGALVTNAAAVEGCDPAPLIGLMRLIDESIRTLQGEAPRDRAVCTHCLLEVPAAEAETMRAHVASCTANPLVQRITDQTERIVELERALGLIAIGGPIDVVDFARAAIDPELARDLDAVDEAYRRAGHEPPVRS